MVAKGHDFPDVTLGVVLDADQTLRFPDFRAEERTFALVTQLAGRAGRGRGRPAAVLVQTLAPAARSIALAARHDSDGFLAGELATPRGARLPAVRVADPDRLLLARRRPTRWRWPPRLHGLIAPPGATVLGPAPLFRLRGRARSQLVIKARTGWPTIRAVGAAVDACAADAVRRGVSVSVDVDPQ